MQKSFLMLAAAGLAALFGAQTATIAIAGPTTQPATAEPALVIATTQPAAVIPPTTQPAVAPAATQPAAAAAATQPADLRAAADERHKHLDPRYRQMNDNQRNAMRTRWADAPVKQTFKPGALVNFSLNNGLLKVDATDFATPIPVRVAVEGSKAVWMLGRQRLGAVNGAFGANAGGAYLTLSRFDFDAKEEEPWQSRLFVNDRTMTVMAQSIYGITNLVQTNGVINLHVSEYTEIGKPLNIVCTAQASSLMQLRAEHPEEFRMFVIPMLARFSDPAFLQPGPADVYSVFVEIPADQKIIHEVEQLVPQLDADDPADRESASAKLRQLGAPAVLAALRLDDSTLSEEQKLRMKAFVAGYRRFPAADPAAQRHNLNFLVDCLEYDDPAIRDAARTKLQSQTHQSVEFDTSLTGSAAARAADAIRKQLLSTPAPVQPSTSTTQPSPQV